MKSKGLLILGLTLLKMLELVEKVVDADEVAITFFLHAVHSPLQE